MRAASTRPALETIIAAGKASISETVNPKSSKANRLTIILCILRLAWTLILRLISQSAPVIGKVRYVRPRREPASKPAAKAANSGVYPTSANIDEDSCRTPING